MPADLATDYDSPAQRARVVSEAWAQENLFCPCCTSPKLKPSATNTRAIDFTCPECEAPFQLKCQSRPLSRRLTDAGYSAMVDAIKNGQTPNFFALHYDRSRWEAQNLVLIPHFALSLSSVEKRKPLGPLARRRGWVGCNIVLANIPPDATIRVLKAAAH